ncbi:MAG: complex I subunit 1 family protein, partial [Chloroflexota bacterium]
MKGLDLLVVVIQILGLLTALSVVVLSLVWFERKLLGRIQRRMGPMRVGFHGVLQPVADAVKLILKEDVVPGLSDKAIFWVAPLLVFAPSFIIWITIPLARDVVIRNMPMGLLFIIAFSVLSITGLILAGWSSANKYAILGGLRSAAQLVSYEIPVVLAIAGVVLIAGSLSLNQIVLAQNIPFILFQPLGFLIFFIGGCAEINRAPFDLMEA